MNHLLKAISLSFQNTPIHIRELLSLDESYAKLLILRLKSLPDISDILVLSTCNRTEVYYSAPEHYNSLIIQTIFELKGLNHTTDYTSYFKHIVDPEEAVQHLFFVAMGLESQVVGDIQISNQVKRAYQLSVDLDVAGPFLHRLLHTIFFTNKRVVQETAFRTGAASTAYAAVELLEELTQQIAQPKVLVVGIGEIGADVCRHLASSTIQDLLICNRTEHKAQALAQECGATVIPFEQLWEAVQTADIVISSIALATPFFSKEKLSQLDILSFKYFIDLSVPRSVATHVEEISGVLVYNIDDIQVKVSQALKKRLQAVPQVKAIVQASIAEFSVWAKEMEVSPTIQKLKQALEKIRLEEMNRYAKKLSTAELEKLDKMTKNMMQKIIKLPVLQLKKACKRGEAETLIDVLNNLFNLEKQEKMKR